MGWTQHGLMRLVDVIRGYKGLNSVRPFCLKEYSLFDRQLHKRPSPLRRIWSAVAAATMLNSFCVRRIANTALDRYTAPPWTTI